MRRFESLSGSLSDKRQTNFFSKQRRDSVSNLMTLLDVSASKSEAVREGLQTRRLTHSDNTRLNRMSEAPGPRMKYPASDGRRNHRFGEPAVSAAVTRLDTQMFRKVAQPLPRFQRRQPLKLNRLKFAGNVVIDFFTALPCPSLKLVPGFGRISTRRKPFSVSQRRQVAKSLPDIDRGFCGKKITDFFCFTMRGSRESKRLPVSGRQKKGPASSLRYSKLRRIQDTMRHSISQVL